MASAVNVPDQQDTAVDYPVVVPLAHSPHNRTEAAGVPLISGGPSAALSAWLPPEFAPRGTTGRLVQLLRLLDEDPSIALQVNDGHVKIPPTVLRLRQLALRCGVSSPSTAGEWLQKWRSRGFLHESPEPTINLRALTAPAGTLSGSRPSVEPPDREDQAAGTEFVPRSPESEKLGLLLSYLERAHHSGHLVLAARIELWVDDLLNPPAATEGRLRGGKPDQDAERATPTPRAPRVTERSEVVSFPSINQEVLTHSLLEDRPERSRDENARATTARPEQPTPRRDRVQLHALLQPLLTIIHQLRLAPMTNYKGVETALRPFSDHQVEHAQRVIRRQMRADPATPISSPIGLLVAQARENNPDYFDAPPPVEELIVEEPRVETGDDETEMAGSVDHKRLLAEARERLTLGRQRNV